jgi:hypothetical protein
MDCGLNALLITHDRAYFQGMSKALKRLRPFMNLVQTDTESELISHLIETFISEESNAVPDLLLIDTRVPKGFHLALLEWRMQNHLAEKLPVVFLLENMCWETIQKYFDYGTNCYVTGREGWLKLMPLLDGLGCQKHRAPGAATQSRISIPQLV